MAISALSAGGALLFGSSRNTLSFDMAPSAASYCFLFCHVMIREIGDTLCDQVWEIIIIIIITSTNSQ
jgi:hypothetical protein